MSDRVTEFNEWMRTDPAIKLMGHATFLTRNVRSAQQLNREQPEVFDELYETAADLIEQAPPSTGPEWLT